MDMKTIRRQAYTSSDPLKEEADGEALSFSSHEKKNGFQISIFLSMLLVCFMGVILFSVMSGVDRIESIVTIGGATSGGRGGGYTNRDKTLGGLLASGFDDQSCLSRYRTGLYRRNMSHKPSRHLVQRLRAHESLQKRCGPGTGPYQKAVEQLRSGQSSKIDQDCNYLVWISYSGLGNRILTVASAFLYSLLTNRVLLVDRGKDIDDLFCEPFPGTSWFLPLDFPLKDKLASFSNTSEESYGNMIKNNVGVDKANYVYLHLDHGYTETENDKLFFCEEDQRTIQNARWLILRSDVYFVPSLFLNPLFEDELNQLFPEKDTVFHHLGRYLFHPTNVVWGLITRYYNSYMAKADERVGIQVRVFQVKLDPDVRDQIISCTHSEGLLPQTVSHEIVPPRTNPKTKAVIFTSLSMEYYEHFRSMYWEKPTSSGEIVSVFQPSYEGFQRSGNKDHDRKAWAEMYLLSLTDKLVTSGWSTFGYVAQGLGGLKPWIMVKPENRSAPYPPCPRDVSMEPCFHSPPFYNCKKKEWTDTGNLVPHIRHCEDISWGVKIVDQNNL